MTNFQINQPEFDERSNVQANNLPYVSTTDVVDENVWSNSET